MSEYNRADAIRAQAEYCKTHEIPCFAPSDGICPFCGCDIYEPNGIAVDDASKYLVTSCPYCGNSFVE